MHPQPRSVRAALVVVFGIATCVAALYEEEAVTGASAEAPVSNQTDVIRQAFDRACASDDADFTKTCPDAGDMQMMYDCTDDVIVPSCYERAFGVEYNYNDTAQRREVMCKDRDKFSTMAECFIDRYPAFGRRRQAFGNKTTALLDFISCDMTGVILRDAKAPENGPGAAAGAHEPSSTVAEDGAGELAQVLPQFYEETCANLTIYRIDMCMASDPDINTGQFCARKALVSACYKEVYGVDFDMDRPVEGRRPLCKDRTKLEGLAACFYRRTNALNPDFVKFLRAPGYTVAWLMCNVNFLTGWS